ncbi:MAG: maleylpyruvate isomerase family mycothiol-dependent enzyme [Streptosporangiaceae bacterium]|jgi:uncharacterized protein (TIGR03083 family)
MEIAEYIDVLRGQGAALAQAAGRAGLDATVPTCSPWLVKDLLRHTGYIHRWAARHITERPVSVLDGPDEAEILRGGGSDEDLIEWFLAGHAALVQTLATADPDVSCGTFMAAPSPLAFWARRQAHETAIHRADAELASGSTPEYPADFAADGIDELIMGFGRRRKYAPAAGGRLYVAATDTGDGWSIEPREGRLQPQRASDRAAAASTDGTDGTGGVGCTVRGPASAVYLFLWNRSGPAPANVTIGGDRDGLTSWQASVRVRWG